MQIFDYSLYSIFHFISKTMAAAWLAAQTMENPSFAGPYAYFQNSPQKIFAGGVASVPAPFIIEALSLMQKGQANEKQMYAMGHSLAAQDTGVCTNCTQDFQACCASTGAERIEQVSPDLMKTCMQSYGKCGGGACMPID
jgi:hypothetical protein